MESGGLVHSFSSKLPYFMRYDCNNYGKWGPVYLAEIADEDEDDDQLPHAPFST